MRYLVSLLVAVVLLAAPSAASAHMEWRYLDMSGLGSTWGDSQGWPLNCWDTPVIYPGQTVRLTGPRPFAWGFAHGLPDWHFHPMEGGNGVAWWEDGSAKYSVSDYRGNKIVGFNKSGPWGPYTRFEHRRGGDPIILRKLC